MPQYLDLALHIIQCDQECFIYIVESPAYEVEEDDLYADYQIPDDLLFQTLYLAQNHLSFRHATNKLASLD